MIVPNPTPLFDELYVPPRLLHRDDEIELLQKLILETFENELSLKALISGIPGIGKTVYSNYTSRNVKNEVKLKFSYVNTFHIAPEIILEKLSYNLKLRRKFESLNISILHKYIMKKVKHGIFIFDKINYKNVNFILNLIKNISKPGIFFLLITNYDELLKLRYFESKDDFSDVVIVLKTYTESQLLDIAKQRAYLVFPYMLDNELIEFIADIVAEYDFSRPATVIEFLRMLYPLILMEKPVSPFTIKKICYEIGLLETDYIFLTEKLNELSRTMKEFILYFFSMIPFSRKAYVDEDELYLVTKEFFVLNNIPFDSNAFASIINTLIDSGLLTKSSLHPRKYYSLFTYDDIYAILSH
ncbi:MAG: hypothetical protein ABGF52_02530 [Candidatus Asgardarchaeum sp.]